MAHKSPKELIELYWTEVWNNRNAEMIRELCAGEHEDKLPLTLLTRNVDALASWGMNR